MGREQVQEQNGNRYCTRMGWELVQEWETRNGSDTMLSRLFFECTNFIAKHPFSLSHQTEASTCIHHQSGGEDLVS